MKSMLFLIISGSILVLPLWQISCSTLKPAMRSPERTESDGKNILSSTDQPNMILLADRHKNEGIECNDCHELQPPRKAVPTDICTTCHQDFLQSNKPVMAGKIDPHNSHLPISDCEVCHHVHEPSEDQCEACHDFGFQIP